MNIKELFRLNRNKKIKVNLFILGAQKCGTTSLFNYLVQEPNIIGSNPKEVDFFSYDNNYLKGRKWYHSHFKKGHGKKYYLDASVEYLYIPDTWERIKKYNPNAKFIILLRDPIERAFSAYQMYKRLHSGVGLKYYENHVLGHNEFYKNQMLNILKSNFFLSFEDFVNKEIEMHKNQRRFWYEPSFLNRGLYFKQIKPYVENFKKENILFIETNKLKTNKINVLKEIFTWLNINSTIDFDLGKNYLVGGYDTSINRDIFLKMKLFFKDSNHMLYDLINEDFDW